MASFEFTLDDAPVLEGLDRLLAGLADPQLLLEQIASYGIASTRERFMTETAPDGSRWAPLNPAYAEMKGGGIEILTRSGALRSSLNLRLGLTEVSWGSPMLYSRIHQLGGVIKPKNAAALAFSLGGGRGLSPVHLVRVQSVTIPARPYLGISPADGEEITAIAGRYLRSLL